MNKTDREKLQQIQFALNARKKKSNMILGLKAMGDLLDAQGNTKVADHLDQAIKALAEEAPLSFFDPGLPPDDESNMMAELTDPISERVEEMSDQEFKEIYEAVMNEANSPQRRGLGLGSTS